MAESMNSKIILVILIIIAIGAFIYYLFKCDQQPAYNKEKIVDHMKQIEEPVSYSYVPPPPNDRDVYTTSCDENSISQMIKNYDLTCSASSTTNSNCESDISDDPRDFYYKKKKYTRRTPDDLKDLFNVDEMLPQEKEDWFDIEPLQTTKKIKSNQLVHPKVHMGIGTIGSSKKNATHDIRGNVPIEKSVFPWMNSTIDPDTNLKSLCG